MQVVLVLYKGLLGAMCLKQKPCLADHTQIFIAQKEEEERFLGLPISTLQHPQRHLPFPPLTLQSGRGVSFFHIFRLSLSTFLAKPFLTIRAYNCILV